MPESDSGVGLTGIAASCRRPAFSKFRHRLNEPVPFELKGWYPMRVRAGLAVLVIVVAAGAACGGGGGGGTPNPTTAIAKGPTSGDGQDAEVTLTLPLPLQVLVTENGAPKADATVTWSTNSVGVIITPGGNTGADGLATAGIQLGTKSGPDTIRATLSGATGSPVRFIVFADPGAASTLVFTTPPHAAQTATALVPNVRVAVADDHGNTVTSANNPITLALSTNPSGATLAGAGPVNAVSGVAVFPALAVSLAGAGYKLTATAAGLTDAVSQAFNVTDIPPPPSAISVTVGVGLLFKSARNGSQNPAVDTLAVGGTVTWNRAGGSHNVQSTGSPSFTSSFGGGSSLTVMGASYQFLFNIAGTYQYDCGVHGPVMSGRVVVK